MADITFEFIQGVSSGVMLWFDTLLICKKSYATAMYVYMKHHTLFITKSLHFTHYMWKFSVLLSSQFCLLSSQDLFILSACNTSACDCIYLWIHPYIPVVNMLIQEAWSCMLYQVRFWYTIMVHSQGLIISVTHSSIFNRGVLFQEQIQSTNITVA